MALSIKSDRADQLARELAATTGESITEATTIALEERLARKRRRRRSRSNERRVASILDEFRALPSLDERPVDEILGYDQDGLPR